jgi:hypothetical protein
MECNAFMRGSMAKKTASARWQSAPPQNPIATPCLLLPGAFLVAVGAQLFAPFMFVNFAFATFF